MLVMIEDCAHKGLGAGSVLVTEDALRPIGQSRDHVILDKLQEVFRFFFPKLYAWKRINTIGCSKKEICCSQSPNEAPPMKQLYKNTGHSTPNPESPLQN